MSFLTEAFNRIPEAATSPLALVAYLAAVSAGAGLSMQIHRNRVRQRLIQDLPEADRGDRVREIIGKPFPDRFSGEQWLRHERNRLLLQALALVAATGIIVFAIAVMRPPAPGPGPGPTDTPTPTPPPRPPTPLEVDAALLSGFGLNRNKDYVHDHFGKPQFVDPARNYRPVPVEIFVKNGYALTVGYDRSGKVSIYSIVVSDEAFRQTTVAQEIGLDQTFESLAADAFIAKDMSSKFYYYAEGHVGSTTSDGFVTYAFFYTDDGVQQDLEQQPPSIDSDTLALGDAPAATEDAKKWRRVAKPNGYLRATHGTIIEGFFFHDTDWKDISQS